MWRSDFGEIADSTESPTWDKSAYGRECTLLTLNSSDFYTSGLLVQQRWSLLGFSRTSFCPFEGVHPTGKS